MNFINIFSARTRVTIRGQTPHADLQARAQGPGLSCWRPEQEMLGCMLGFKSNLCFSNVRDQQVIDIDKTYSGSKRTTLSKW